MNNKLITKAISFIKYQGTLKDFAEEKYHPDIDILESQIKNKEELPAEFIESQLYLWLTPKKMGEFLTKKFDQNAYRILYRQSKAKGTGRGRVRQTLPKEEEKITLLFFLAKDLNVKYFNQNQETLLNVYNATGLDGLIDLSFNPKAFYRSFYFIWKTRINLHPTYLLQAPDVFFQNPQNWEEPLENVIYARKKENLIYLWESLSIIGKATLKILYNSGKLPGEL